MDLEALIAYFSSNLYIDPVAASITIPNILPILKTNQSSSFALMGNTTSLYPSTLHLTKYLEGWKNPEDTSKVELADVTPINISIPVLLSVILILQNINIYFYLI